VSGTIDGSPGKYGDRAGAAASERQLPETAEGASGIGGGESGAVNPPTGVDNGRLSIRCNNESSSSSCWRVKSFGLRGDAMTNPSASSPAVRAGGGLSAPGSYATDRAKNKGK